MAGVAWAETKNGKEVEGLSKEAWEWIIKGIRVKDENYDEAIKCYKKAITIDSGSALPYRFLGVVYQENVNQRAFACVCLCARHGIPNDD